MIDILIDLAVSAFLIAIFGGLAWLTYDPNPLTKRLPK